MPEKQTCFYCGATAGKTITLEKHHIFGRVNSEIYVYACLNCHNQITDMQNSLPPWVRSSTAPEIVKRVYGLISGGAHLIRYGEEQVRLGKEIIKWFEEWQQHT